MWRARDIIGGEKRAAPMQLRLATQWITIYNIFHIGGGVTRAINTTLDFYELASQRERVDSFVTVVDLVDLKQLIDSVFKQELNLLNLLKY